MSTKRVAKWPAMKDRRQRVLTSLEKKQKELIAVGSPMTDHDTKMMEILREYIKNEAGKCPAKKAKAKARKKAAGENTKDDQDPNYRIGVWKVSIDRKKKKDRYKVGKAGKKVKTKKTYTKTLDSKTYDPRTYTFPQVRAMFKSNNRVRYVVKAVR